MKKYDFGICGAFDFEEKATGGQSIKTREFYLQLADTVGKEKICILESTSYKSNPFVFLLRLMRMTFECKDVLILPAQNGIKLLSPILVILKNITGVHIHYSVIGGWLPDLLKKKRGLRNHLLRFDSILVETSVMKSDLESLGLRNVFLLQNFKRLKPIDKSLLHNTGVPVKLCYFSRVLKQKGIEDAVVVVERINHSGQKCILDIYGPIVDDYKDEFKKLMDNVSDTITYRGVVKPSDSTSILKEYDLQLFPTQYKTEGIPGSIVDSYFAGVPVVASRWNSYEDVVIEGDTGIGFKIHDVNDFYNVLYEIVRDPKRIDRMRMACIDKAKEYMPETVIKQFFKIIEYAEVK